MNILDTRFETPFNTAPFSKIKTDAFLPAFRKAIESAKNEINQIKSATTIIQTSMPPANLTKKLQPKQGKS